MNETVADSVVGEPTRASLRWAVRLFVPVATLLLVAVGGYWVQSRVDVNLLTAAQNERLTFQGKETAGNTGLSDAEMKSANEVLDPDRPVEPGKIQLLYLGNSQTMAIMDRQAGDLSTPQWVEVMLARRGAPVAVRLGSLPNITSDEMVLSLVAAATSHPARAHALVVGLVLEEFRGVGIRAEMRALAERAEAGAALKELAQQNQDLAGAQPLGDALQTEAQSGARTAAVGSGGRDWTSRIDERLGHLASLVPLVEERDNVTGMVGLGYMAVRNRVLGITSSSLRPVPDAMFRANVQLTELMLRYAKQQRIPVVIYLAPIRPIRPNPNDPADVERFRRELPSLCARYGVRCLDYLDLVPEGLWTNYPLEDNAGKGGQRDFAHFTGPGHKLVAERLFPELLDALAFAKEPDIRPAGAQ